MSGRRRPAVDPASARRGGWEKDKAQTCNVRPSGLYFLDEPETPLSPTRELALLALIVERVTSNCQFLIANHAPILMAVPNAEILLLEDGAIKPVAYEDVERVVVTKAFLQDPAKFLRRL